MKLSFVSTNKSKLCIYIFACMLTNFVPAIFKVTSK